MRKFLSYGPVNKDLHYYVRREQLIREACTHLIGDVPDSGGHYITVWAPRQTGKTWVMNEVMFHLMSDERFHVLKMELEHLKMQTDPLHIIQSIADELIQELNLKNVNPINSVDEFQSVFLKEHLKKPLILIMDEFDSLDESAITGIVSTFRNIYNRRGKESNLFAQKEYLLHGVALIGVRSVIGIENRRGSPFNIQRSMHIPNLTFEEVEFMFKWYEQESGQKVDPEVIHRIFTETCGQPGLVSWLGELLTEGYEGVEPDHSKPITLYEFEEVYADAIDALPNSNIINIISKAKQEPYRELVLELFKTREVMRFKFDDERLNFLYMHGVIDREKIERTINVTRFSSPFVQKRLFNYFSHDLFGYMGQIFEPFEDTSDTFTPEGLNIRNLMHRYEKHLQENREWMFKDAPRRNDLKVYEAVFHFNLYEYLVRFFGSFRTTRVWPEFPTGNGKVDLLIRHQGRMYGLEVKSYKDKPAYDNALIQAAHYGNQLGLKQIHLVVFLESISQAHREQYEVDVNDPQTGVIVSTVFVETGT